MPGVREGPFALGGPDPGSRLGRLKAEESGVDDAPHRQVSSRGKRDSVSETKRLLETKMQTPKHIDLAGACFGAVPTQLQERWIRCGGGVPAQQGVCGFSKGGPPSGGSMEANQWLD